MAFGGGGGKIVNLLMEELKTLRSLSPKLRIARGLELRLDDLLILNSFYLQLLPKFLNIYSSR